MAIAAAAAFISRLVQEKTGLNASITALLLGTILSYSGAVPNAILDKDVYKRQSKKGDK